MFAPLVIEGLKSRLLCWLGAHKWDPHRVMGVRICLRCSKRRK